MAYDYDHLFMGTAHHVTFPATAIAVSRTDDIHQNIDMATRISYINYRWGSPVIAKSAQAAFARGSAYSQTISEHAAQVLA